MSKKEDLKDQAIPAPTADKKKRGKSKKKTKEQVAELEAEKAEMKDKYLRLFAEFDNHKKRTARERIELMKTAARETIVTMLPVMDDFDRAVQANGEEVEEGSALEGFIMIQKKMQNIMRQTGLKEMESTGELFDPNLHEAISEIPAPSEDMKGKIIDTVQKGYLLNDVIIRHARVVIGK